MITQGGCAALLLLLAASCARQGKTDDGSAYLPTPAEKAELAEHFAPMRVQLAEFLAKDQNADSKMLAFFLGGDDEILGGPWGWWGRWHAEELVFFELALQEHSDQEWDQILARKGWLRSWPKMEILGWDPKPLDPQALDKMWSRARLQQALAALQKAEGEALVSAIRDLRIYRYLDRNREETRASILAATEAAAERIQSNGDARIRLAFLLLMDAVIAPASLNPLIWSAAQDPDPALRAQALLLGPRVPDSKTDPKKDAGTWRLQCLSALRDPNPLIAEAALVSLIERVDLTEQDLEPVFSRALSVLTDGAKHESNPRLLVDCLEFLSTQPFGAENPKSNRWWEIVSPLLASRESAVRAALPALAIHRFPGSPEAHKVVTTLTSDRRRTVCDKAWEQIEHVELGPSDLAWLRKFSEDESPLVRIFVTVAMRSATGDDFNEETCALILRWANENLDPDHEKQKNRLGFYLRMIRQSRRAYLPWRPLLEKALESPLERNRMQARICLAARGWLSPALLQSLKESLPAAKGEERQGILIALYLTAHRNGDPKTASAYLNQLMEGEDRDLYYVARFALEAGGLTKTQKDILARSFMADIEVNPLRLSERQRKLWARLGSTWKLHIAELEDLKEWAEECAESREEGWYSAQETARHLTLFLETLGTGK